MFLLLYLARPSTNIGYSAPVEKRDYQTLFPLLRDRKIGSNRRARTHPQTNKHTNATKRIISPGSRSIMICSFLDESEKLVMSCFNCAKLFTFLDLSSGTFQMAYEEPHFIPGPLCSDGKSSLYVMNMAQNGNGFIYSMDCSTDVFKRKSLIQTGMDSIHSMCTTVVPSSISSGQIVLTSQISGLVKGISFTKNSAKPWEYRGLEYEVNVRNSALHQWQHRSFMRWPVDCQ